MSTFKRVATAFILSITLFGAVASFVPATQHPAAIIADGGQPTDLDVG